MVRAENIVRYIEHCEKQYGFVFSLKDYTGFMSCDPEIAVAFAPYYVHRSAFCVHIKSKPVLFTRCRGMNSRMEHKCLQAGGPFYGKCYCGVSELVLPIVSGQRLVGSVSVGGMETDTEEAMRRIEALARKHRLSVRRLKALYADTLTAKPGDPDLAGVLGAVLTDYMALLYEYLAARGEVLPGLAHDRSADQLNILSNAIDYIHYHYSSDIYLCDVAVFCCCSESYLSHLFRRMLNEPFSAYVNRVRIDAAKALLAETEQSVTEVAQACGFSDPNYFSNVFRRAVASSPSAYRKQRHRVKRDG